MSQHEDDTEAQPSSNQPTPATYEEARAELVDVVRTLEQGGVSLEESIALWERGEALAARCETFLDGARARLDNAAEERGDR